MKLGEETNQSKLYTYNKHMLKSKRIDSLNNMIYSESYNSLYFIPDSEDVNYDVKVSQRIP